MFKTPPQRSLWITITLFIAMMIAGYIKAPGFTGKAFPFLPGERSLNSRRGESYSRVEMSIEERHRKFRKFITTNSQVALFTLIAGTIFFPCAALKISLFGFIIGVLFWHLGSVGVFIRLMFPHSLTEIPMILYYCAIAQSSGWKWLSSPKGSRWSCLKCELRCNLKLFGVIIMPWVLFNALLEAYATNRF